MQILPHLSLKELETKLVISEEVEVTEFAPQAFSALRALDGYSQEALKAALEIQASSKFSEQDHGEQGGGRSGSFIFRSSDQRLLIKTMSEADFRAFLRVQRAYFERVQNDPASLLARIYGIYSVQVEDQRPVRLIVMENVIRNAGPETVLGIFDLKGSSVDRIVKQKHVTPSMTLKDLNLKSMNKKMRWLNFRESDRKKIMQVLAKDVQLLEQHKLMDYSLLLCIQRNPDRLTPRGTKVRYR